LHLWHDRWIEPVDQCGKFGFEALVVVVGTLAHNVAHFPIAICGLTVLAAGFGHDAETVPALRLMRVSHEERASSYSGVFQLARVDELDHPVGGIGNPVILIVVPCPRKTLGKGLFEVVDVQVASLGAFLGIGPLVGEYDALLCLILCQATLLVLLTTAAGAGIIASGFGHFGQHLEALGRFTLY